MCVPTRRRPSRTRRLTRRRRLAGVVRAVAGPAPDTANRRLKYTMTRKDCLQCLEGLTCLPECLALGTCSELPDNPHDEPQDLINKQDQNLLSRR